MVGLPGFGPGSFPHTTASSALREPKSHKDLANEGRDWRILRNVGLFTRFSLY